MIKIERWFAPDMIQRYEKKMLKKIKKNYRSNGLANSIKIYFEENGCFSERKVRELLVGKITKQKIQSFPEITKKQRKKLGEFFSYKFLQNDQIRHELIASLGIQVCPYCNRQYITSWCNGKKTRTTADIDHFYPKETYPLLRDCKNINFVGSVEARDIAKGGTDILVCEAFVGNVILKFFEGVAKTFLGCIKEGIMKSLRTKIGGMLIKPALKGLLKTFDVSSQGGAPLLGLKGLVVKAHGNSKSAEIKTALGQCITFKENSINEKIQDKIQA